VLFFVLIKVKNCCENSAANIWMRENLNFVADSDKKIYVKWFRKLD
jgi:hypothetical protein